MSPNSNPFDPPPHESLDPTQDSRAQARWVKPLVLALVGVLFLAGLYFARGYLNLDFLAAQESRLKEYYQQQPLPVLAAAFLIYVAVTGLSIPGATILSLTYAWFFKFWTGLILTSFASTAGATIAFLLSRYLFRDWIQAKFGERLETINNAFDREGNFYLFLARLIPAFPFFVVNVVMGLTKIKATTFWWVSQLGMLAGTIVYVYAGASIPDLMTLKTDGIGAVFERETLIQLTIAFALLGLFPIVAKKLVTRFVSDQSAIPSE